MNPGILRTEEIFGNAAYSGSGAEEKEREEAENLHSALCAVEKADFGGRRILIVDDNALNREIAGELLAGAGFKTDTAEDGRDALDKIMAAPAGRYALVLMDIQMPRMDGYAAARAIRALPEAEKAGIPIYALSANATEELRKKTREAGMNGYFSKPLNISQLLRTLEEEL